jgi:hypothetical protein
MCRQRAFQIFSNHQIYRRGTALRFDHSIARQLRISLTLSQPSSCRPAEILRLTDRVASRALHQIGATAYSSLGSNSVLHIFSLSNRNVYFRSAHSIRPRNPTLTFPKHAIKSLTSKTTSRFSMVHQPFHSTKFICSANFNLPLILTLTHITSRFCLLEKFRACFVMVWCSLCTAIFLHFYIHRSPCDELCLVSSDNFSPEFSGTAKSSVFQVDIEQRT